MASKAKAVKAKAMTKAQMVGELATATGLTKAQVNSVVAAVDKLVTDELQHGRTVALFGLVKILSAHKPATPARPGKNPFTGESITIKAKPARKVIKVRALKALKDKL